MLTPQTASVESVSVIIDWKWWGQMPLTKSPSSFFCGVAEKSLMMLSVTMFCYWKIIKHVYAYHRQTMHTWFTFVNNQWHKKYEHFDRVYILAFRRPVLPSANNQAILVKCWAVVIENYTNDIRQTIQNRADFYSHFGVENQYYYVWYDTESLYTNDHYVGILRTVSNLPSKWDLFNQAGSLRCQPFCEVLPLYLQPGIHDSILKATSLIFASQTLCATWR